MVQTRSCDYCGTDIEPGTGTMFVHIDGRVVHYCSSKCENNADLGRASRDLEWTEEGQRVGASRAGTPEEVEQVAAEPTETETEAEAVIDETDTVEAESEAEAVAATAGDTGSRSGEPAATEDERVDDAAEVDTDEISEVEGRRAGGTDPDVGEEETPTGEGATGEETDPEEAEATVGETTHETDESEAEFDEEDVERTGDETVSEDETDEVIVDEEREETEDE